MPTERNTAVKRNRSNRTSRSEEGRTRMINKRSAGRSQGSTRTSIRERQQRVEREDTFLSQPSAQKDIAGVILAVIAIALFLAVVVPSQALVTVWVHDGFLAFFGIGAYLIPIALFLCSLTLFIERDQESPFTSRIGLGLALFIFAIMVIAGLMVPGAKEQANLAISPAFVNAYGGYVGGIIASWLLVLIGQAISLVIMIGVIIASFIVLGFSITAQVTKVRLAIDERRRAIERKRYEEEMQIERIDGADHVAREAAAEKERKKQSRLPFGGLFSKDQGISEDQLKETQLLDDEQAGSIKKMKPVQTSVTDADTRYIGERSGTKTTLLGRGKKDGSSAPESGVSDAKTRLLDGAKAGADKLEAQDKNGSKRRVRTSSGGGGLYATAEPLPTEGFVLPAKNTLVSHGEKFTLSKEQRAEFDETQAVLQATLHEFGLQSKVVGWIAGPTVTTFKIEMGEGERLNRINSLEDDIALALAAQTVRIFSPIPGTSYVGIEIPNMKRSAVHLGDVIGTLDDVPLALAFGRDIEGKPVTANLAKMPHLLIGGTTGSGKSVMLNSLIISLLMRNTPAEVRLIMVDPKRVELTGYNGIPQLYVPVVTDPREAASALQWAVSEMERRLKIFSKVGARNIGSFNRMVQEGKFEDAEKSVEQEPYLVIIIDELSDLMMVAGKDVEGSIIRIAQLGRAAGVHLIVATQRPAAEVVTNAIKVNINSRIAFAVATAVDSRVILDMRGAEKLIGHGDMLYSDPSHGGKPMRVQGCYVSDEEIAAVVDHLKAQGDPEYHTEILSTVLQSAATGGATAGASGQDPLLWDAAEAVLQMGMGSTSGLQRRLGVGYARAGRIIDMLEERGIVGPGNGSKAREVLVDHEGLEAIKAFELQDKDMIDE